MDPVASERNQLVSNFKNRFNRTMVNSVFSRKRVNSNLTFKDIYFVIYGIISEFTDKGQFQYLTNLKGPQEGTYLYTIQFLSLR